MRIIIRGSRGIEFRSLDDLAKLVPSTLTGKSLNYGQGEGQVQIEKTIWGVYVRQQDKDYCLQYEEGLEEPKEFQLILRAILNNLKSEFGQNLTFIVEGCLEHYESHEKYT